MVYKWLYPLVALVASTCALASIFIPLYTATQQTPPGMKFEYAYYGSRFDYYSYLSMIRQGQRGKILLTSPYTEQHLPPTFLHTIHFLVGIVTRLTGVTPAHAFLLFRFLSMGLFFASIYALIHTVFSLNAEKIAAFIMVIFSTSFWSKELSGITEPIMHTDAFSITKKFILPPHHFLSIACMILIFLLLQKPTWRRALSSAVSLIILNILNPFMFLITLPILGIYGGFQFLHKSMTKKMAIVHIGFLLPAIFFSLVINATNLWLLSSLNYYAQTVHAAPPSLSAILPYIFSLGPTGAIGFIAFLYYPMYKDRKLLFVFIWALVPFLLWIASTQKLPVNYTRLYQTYQYIPFAILATYACSIFLKRLPRVIHSFYLILLSLVVVAYSTIPLQQNVPLWFHWANVSYRNIYIPETLLTTFEYLRKNTPIDSVVLADEIISNMAPAYTNNRVIIGANDTVPDYQVRITGLWELIQGSGSIDSVFNFAKKYQISYIIVGGDIPRGIFENALEAKLLKPLYKNAEYTVLQINWK